MDITRFGPTAEATDVAAAIASDGAAIVEDLVTGATIDAVMGEMAPHLDATPNGADDFAGQNTRRTGALLARSPSSVAMVAHPLVLGVADNFLWPSKTTFQVHLTQMIAIGGGSPQQALHRDQWCFDFFPFPDDVEVELSTMWALTDFTPANGATRFIPGSHREGDHVLADEYRCVQAAMPRGSVLLYSGRTVHGGGANTTDEVRIGLNVDYTLGWLRQEENQYLSVPPEVARTLPDGVAELAGYSLGGYALGYVDDVRDPRHFLRGTASQASFGPTPDVPA
jgi:ectoine hydroxylase-related dioxygenase (phytanoyl-CoA dioxygenase family)